MSGKRWAVLGLVVLAVAAAGIVSLGRSLASRDVERLAPVGAAWEPGGAEWLEIPAADVEFTTLEGGKASLVDHRGEVVVLNFWGTWCPPCRREIPELVALQEALGPHGTVIGVAVESRPAEIRAFIREFGVDYPIWLSSAGKGLAHFDAMGYPFTVLIDRSGVIRRQYLGPQSVETLAADVERLIDLELALPETG